MSEQPDDLSPASMTLRWEQFLIERDRLREEAAQQSVDEWLCKEAS